MRLLLWSRIGLAALLAAAGCEEESIPKKPRVEIAIPSGECIDICGGEICYDAVSGFIESRNSYSGLKKKEQKLKEDITAGHEKKALWSYSITANGFEDYFTLNKKMIFADECVFYRESLDAEKLVLERLR